MLSLLFAIAAFTAPPADVLNGRPAKAYEANIEVRARAAQAYHLKVEVCGDAEVTFLRRSNVPRKDNSYIAESYYIGGPIVIEHLQVTGCGRSTRENLLVLRGETGIWWQVQNRVPGESLAGPRLQEDVGRMQLGIINRVNPPGCQNPAKGYVIGEVVVVKPPGQDGSWVERWPFKSCGIDRPIEVTFTPTPEDGGTDFAIRPLWGETT